MTLTLQDAQLVSWKIFRKINDKLDPEKSKSWNPFVMVSDLLKEAGRVATAVKGLEGLESLENCEAKEILTGGLNDLLYSVFILAEHYDVNLDETFLQQVNDHLLRFLT